MVSTSSTNDTSSSSDAELDQRQAGACARPPIHAPGARPVREVVADRGAAADADEQPRPGERRAPRGPRRVRRDRQGRAQLGVDDALVRTLRDLEDDETMLVQSSRSG